MTDLLTNHARALALRGKLIGAGFDPLAVAYGDKSECYVVVLQSLPPSDTFTQWADSAEMRIVDTLIGGFMWTYILERKDAQP